MTSLPIAHALCASATSGWVAAGDPLSHVLPHEVARFGEYKFTNHILMLIVAALLLMIFVPILARRQSLVPKGIHNFFETLLQFIREEVARPVLGKHTDKYIPLLWSYFFLILTANLLGMIPFGAIAGLIGQDTHVLALHRRHCHRQPDDHGGSGDRGVLRNPHQRHARTGHRKVLGQLLLRPRPDRPGTAHDSAGDHRRGHQAVCVGRASVRQHDGRPHRAGRHQWLRRGGPATRGRHVRRPPRCRCSGPWPSPCWSCSSHSCRPTSSPS